MKPFHTLLKPPILKPGHSGLLCTCRKGTFYGVKFVPKHSNKLKKKPPKQSKEQNTNDQNVKSGKCKY